MQTDASCILGDLGAVFECVEYKGEIIPLHRDQEAGAELGARGTRIEESRSGVSEGFGRHQSVGGSNAVHIGKPEPHGYTEPHVLRGLQDSSCAVAHKIGPFQCLEAEVIQQVIVLRLDHGV